ncbi:MAG: hypothetical protein LKJ47_05015 [Bifidobacteriaceae bacterium]|jgi:hypothetical protein|nr:hypothetical protein [Bifidobacteriaceae bacterium]
MTAAALLAVSLGTTFLVSQTLPSSSISQSESDVVSVVTFASAVQRDETSNDSEAAASRSFNRQPIKTEGITTAERTNNDFVDTAGYKNFVADSIKLSKTFDEKLAEAKKKALVETAATYTLAQFMSSGVVNWGGHRFTYYSQSILPGGGLAISGRHVNSAGYVCDGDGYIVLAGSAAIGTTYETPFGAKGKVYDRGVAGAALDVYIR